MITLLFLLFVAQGDGIASEDIGPLVGQETFTLAVEKFNSVERKESQPLFEALVRNIEAKADRDANDHRMLLESLNYLAIITYPEGSEKWYRKMIATDPGYDLPLEETISPKIRAIYEGLRKQLLGQLRVSASDVATGYSLDRLVLLVDGAILGPVVGERLVTLPAGKHSVELMRPNYSGGLAQIEIVAGSESSFSPTMSRVSAEAVIVTSPPDVEIKVNGQSMGFSRLPAPEAYRLKLAEKGIPFDNAGVFILDHLAINGKAEISLERGCFLPILTTFPVSELKQLLIEPLKLEPAQAFLSVRTPSGENGVVMLNGSQVGILPLENQKVCPGTYEVKVQFSDGSFVTHLTLSQNEKRELVAQPQPTLAWLGIDLNGESAPPQNPVRWVRELKTWAVLETALSDGERDALKPLFDGKITDQLREQLLHRQEADLYFAARVVRHKQVIRRMEGAFWSPRSSLVKTFAVDFRELEKLQEFLNGLDQLPPLVKPWLGIQVGRIARQTGVQVLEVHPAGPLAGKIKVGEWIRSINGSPLRDPGELLDLESSDSVSLELDDRSIQVVPQPSITEIPYGTGQSVPPAWIAKLAKIAKYDSSALLRQSASFNLARFLFFTGDYKPAFDLFSTLQLPSKPGINAGTLFFYQGLCFRKLNLASEAQDAFRQVLNFPDATLFDAYGPQAAFWADAELKNNAF